MVVEQLFSLITISSLLNNTDGNQGNHCITAINLDSSRPAIAPGNQMLSGDPDTCKGFAGLLLLVSLVSLYSYAAKVQP